MEDLWSHSLDLHKIKMWLLVLCAISSPCEDDLTILMGMIASHIKDQASASWHGIVLEAQQMPWVDTFDPLCDEVGQRLVNDPM